MGGKAGNMPHCTKNFWSRAGLIPRIGHNEFVAVPLKKPDDTGYPKCPDRAPADVPAGAPLLKVYDYGPLGARFFKSRMNNSHVWTTFTCEDKSRIYWCRAL